MILFFLAFHFISIICGGGIFSSSCLAQDASPPAVVLQNSTLQNPVSKNTLTYCMEVGPQNLNPQKASDSNTFYVTRSIYSRLLEFKKGEFTLEPSLAESWTVSADLLTYTFKLRKNVAFHENMFFTPKRFFQATDVVFSFQKMLNPQHPFYSMGKGDYEYFKALDLKDILKDVEAVDEQTVRMTLKKAYAPFLSLLAMDFASIVSEEYAKHLLQLKKTELFEDYPIGTHAFYLDSYAKDKSLTLKRFQKFWKKNIYLEAVQFEILADEKDRKAALISGQCHITGALNYNSIAEIKKQNNLFLVLEKPGLNTSYLAINTQKKPFDNIRVRQAVAMTLNRKKYIEQVFSNQALLARNLIPPFVLGHNEQVSDYKYDPVQAKKIFKEEGFEDGTLDLWVLPIARSYLQNAPQLAELMKEDFFKAGIRLNFIHSDWPQYLSKTKNGEHGLALFGWVGDNGDPDNFFSPLLTCAAVESGSNRSRWCSREFDDLIEKAQSSYSNKVRSDAYRRAQLVVRSGIPHVPLAHAKIFRILRKNVQGYKIDPLGSESFEEVKLLK